jgi:hypothetical protein
MNPFVRLALACLLALSGMLPLAHAASAKQQLDLLDKTTYSGDLQLSVTLHAPPPKGGKAPQPQRYPARLLFERPDRFRLELRPGAGDEYRAVASAGTVRWLDLATGLSGNDKIERLADPLAIALLGAAGDLLRSASATDLPVSAKAKLSGARLQPKTWGSHVRSGYAWFDSANNLVGLEFVLGDDPRVHLAVLQLKRNVQTTPGDFEL